MKTVDGPRGSRLLGLTREIVRDAPGTYERVMRGYPEVGLITIGVPGRRLRLYLVSHPDGVQRVLTASGREHVKDTPFYREIAAWVGDGLLTSEGAAWRQQRRTLAPLFTPRRVATYATVMAEEAAAVADRWRRSTTVDLHADMTEFTLQVVARVLFGTSVEEAVPAVREMFPVLNAYVRDRAFSPVRLPRSWPTPRQRRATLAQRTLYGLVDRIVGERRRAGTGAEAGDLVSLLLAARDPETGAPLSADEIRDQVLIFLLAGHETTATTLTFGLHLLGHHPAVQERVRREAHEVFGDRAPTADDAARLTYTGTVVKEAMRLYPPGFAIGRFTHGGDVVSGYRIPPRSIVVVSPWAVHRHPQFWPEPDRFDPDRFRPEPTAARHRYAYLPFSGGPRNCIGNHFAMLEATIAVATLARAVRLRTEPTTVPLEAGITLRPAGAVPAAVDPSGIPDGADG